VNTLTEQLNRYGYSLTGQGELIHPTGHASRTAVTVKRGRAQVRAITTDQLLWSGPPSMVGSFLERFWFAEVVA
jgi:hypothetical protein